MAIRKITTITADARDYEVGQPFEPGHPRFGNVVKIERRHDKSFVVHNPHGGTVTLMSYYVNQDTVVED